MEITAVSQSNHRYFIIHAHSNSISNQTNRLVDRSRESIVFFWRIMGIIHIINIHINNNQYFTLVEEYTIINALVIK